MTRPEAISRIADPTAEWDVLVIGGGATGLGTAVDAAARGFRTLLLEQHDFAKATSSRSTKLIHGGVRYLRQGRLGLVRESLRERGLLIQNAPHLVEARDFLVPAYHLWELPYYYLGLKAYDRLAGRLGLRSTHLLRSRQAIETIPTLRPEGLYGGIVYTDGQFDDADLAIALARTLADLGGTPVNYCAVTGLKKTNGQIRGVIARDLEGGKEHSIHARAVINATGIFADTIRRMDETEAPQQVTWSRGTHIVVDRAFLPTDTAVMIPKTEDGRILFAIPWKHRTIIGTTDVPVDKPSLEPRPHPDEIRYLLDHTAAYLSRSPTTQDIRSTYAGLRPLVAPARRQKTARISREHQLLVAPSGLITVAGGKWTTYRKMAEDAVNRAIEVASLEKRPCATRSLQLHGAAPSESWPQDPQWRPYGADAQPLRALLSENPDWERPIHPALPYLQAEVIWAVRHRMARTTEDILARRTRALLLDAEASLEAARLVTSLLAGELQRDAAWEEEQLAQYRALAKAYLP